MENYINGILPDTRTEEAKALDYHQSEIVTAPAPVIWTKKATLRQFPVRMQSKSGSCVMQSLEKERGIRALLKYGEFPVFSASYGYQLRANPSISGSTKPDRIKAANKGAILEPIMPSQSLSDEEMMSIHKPSYADDLAKIFGVKAVDIDIDIDTIASTIEATGKGVGVWFRFGPGEWFYRKEVGIVDDSKEWGHAVVAVDYTLNDKGEKCLVIEDSACEDGFPQRLVPESFFKARCFLASYLVDFKKFNEVLDTPVYDGSIVSLQDILKYNGLFPANQDSTGIFGNITRTALISFQKKYGIEPALGNLGPITEAKLRELYS